MDDSYTESGNTPSEVPNVLAEPSIQDETEENSESLNAHSGMRF